MSKTTKKRRVKRPKQHLPPRCLHSLVLENTDGLAAWCDICGWTFPVRIHQQFGHRQRPQGT